MKITIFTVDDTDRIELINSNLILQSTKEQEKKEVKKKRMEIYHEGTPIVSLLLISKTIFIDLWLNYRSLRK
ncbi:hypothetical protein DERF_001894 [Dermatophagoides farinae]|uniref:Uncharacterized protein n=1 Tax=Dermatophagoides farinae TaxID=6954 RepID=A0A922LBJ3_DERFA|nr:hypothetical protein DERF_001894 [Dermatophagoides farinae]